MTGSLESLYLTDHFLASEFLRSQVAARMGRTLTPTPDVLDNLRRLCVYVLEPLRVALGRPIIITSGWRPSWLNSLIGGAAKSAHVDGRAADCETVGMTSSTFARFIQRQGLPIDKCILEFPEASGGGWVHIQVAKPNERPRFEFLTARRVGGVVQYLEGIQ